MAAWRHVSFYGEHIKLKIILVPIFHMMKPAFDTMGIQCVAKAGKARASSSPNKNEPKSEQR
jgi:hypothetical protein